MPEPEFLQQYGLFLAKIVTWVAALVVTAAAVAGLAQRARRHDKSGHLEIRCLNDRVAAMRDAIEAAVLSPAERKKAVKAKKVEKKKAEKRRGSPSAATAPRKRVYVLDFDGDLRASAVSELREDITAILGQAVPGDEVVVRIESGGGMVHSYGLAASQLDRIKAQAIPLTVAVDKVAASGGYMMACVADKILAAPFAVLGSIGVVAQIPNVHRLLKKHDIDIELMTAGKYKRTLTMLGENTEQARDKFRETLEDTHQLFKDFVRSHRPRVDIDSVATGEAWFGTRAKEFGLVDELVTSDEYLVAQIDTADVYEIAFVRKKKLADRIGVALEASGDRLLLRWLRRLLHPTYYI